MGARAGLATRRCPALLGGGTAGHLNASPGEGHLQRCCTTRRDAPNLKHRHRGSTVTRIARVLRHHARHGRLTLSDSPRLGGSAQLVKKMLEDGPTISRECVDQLILRLGVVCCAERSADGLPRHASRTRAGDPLGQGLVDRDRSAARLAEGSGLVDGPVAALANAQAWAVSVDSQSWLDVHSGRPPSVTRRRC